MPAGRPPKFNTPEEMQEAIDAWYAKCEEDKVPLTITGLALELDMDRKTLNNYKNKDEFFPVVKKARSIVTAKVESLLLSGHAAAGTIFWLKNNAEWADKTETDITTGGKPINNWTVVPVTNSKE
ncbi:MAG: hypothetical protein KAS32_28585 [Candidatus Peribacteraceae bacterium]|nr:hypothetical protein [Candidatus Peribacteraceae bacterium]